MDTFNPIIETQRKHAPIEQPTARQIGIAWGITTLISIFVLGLTFIFISLI